jgi:hypothetical protein
MEGLDAHPVPRKDQPSLGPGKQRNREHPPQPVETARVPLREGVQHNLGVAFRMKLMSTLFEIPFQRAVIVNFAIEDDDRFAVVANDRLIASVQIDNLQTNSAK